MIILLSYVAFRFMIYLYMYIYMYFYLRQVFSENPASGDRGGGCVNFITGAGGLLQAVMFGYGGLRLHPDRLEFYPHLLPNVTAWTLFGLHYRGAVFDMEIDGDRLVIRMRTVPLNTRVVVSSNENVNFEGPGVHQFRKQKGSILVEDIGTGGTHGQTPLTTPKSGSQRVELSNIIVFITVLCAAMLR